MTNLGRRSWEKNFNNHFYIDKLINIIIIFIEDFDFLFNKQKPSKVKKNNAIFT